MSQRIMFLCGSPQQNGNTNTAVRWAAAAAEQAGARVEIVDAAALRSRTNGCTACMGCQRSEKFECVIDDEVSAVLRRVAAQDVIVFATPVYCFGPTAQLKIFIDRMFSLEKIDLKTGKFTSNLRNVAMALLATAGGNDFRDLVSTFKHACQFSRQRFTALTIPFAGTSGELIKNPKARKRAEAFGRKLAGF